VIVLDEQISNQKMIDAIGGWYRGKIVTIGELRPGTVILDDAIPSLLRKKSQPVFVTVNVSDFWRKVSIDQRFCVVCFTEDDAYGLSVLLKELLHKPEFKNRRKRAGHVFRITADGKTQLYNCNSREIQEFKLQP
jgi:hypothetical protein